MGRASEGREEAEGVVACADDEWRFAGIIEPGGVEETEGADGHCWEPAT